MDGLDSDLEAQKKTKTENTELPDTHTPHIEGCQNPLWQMHAFPFQIYDSSIPSIWANASFSASDIWFNSPLHLKQTYKMCCQQSKSCTRTHTHTGGGVKDVKIHYGKCMHFCFRYMIRFSPPFETDIQNVLPNSLKVSSISLRQRRKIDLPSFTLIFS